MKTLPSSVPPQPKAQTSLLPSAGVSTIVVPMANVSGDTYEAVIPAADVTLSGLQYYLTATDNFETTSYSAYPDEPYFVVVEEGLMVTSKIWTWKGRTETQTRGCL